MNRALATACSDEYFFWLLNLLGSIQVNYPAHPQIIVYDLGLSKSFRKEVESIRGVTVIPVEPFVPHWRKCYTWKLWALLDVPSKAVFFLDAASEVLQPLDEVYSHIEQDGYFCVNQRHTPDSTLDVIVPADLLKRLGLDASFLEKHGHESYFALGNFGYMKDTPYHDCLRSALELAKEGWTLGWSAIEQHRNKGHDRTSVLRRCKLYRHDMSVVNVLFYSKFGSLLVRDDAKYGGRWGRKEHENQLVYQGRRSNLEMRYLNSLQYTSGKRSLWVALNRLRYMFFRVGLFFQKAGRKIVRGMTAERGTPGE